MMRLLIYIFTVMCFLWGESAYAQTAVLSGKVTEKTNGGLEPVIGANVVVVNKQNRFLTGTTTNFNGDYNLRIPTDEGDLVIMFSFIGMKEQKVKYTGQQKINVTLEMSALEMDEVVVEGKRIERNDMGISHKEQISATQKVNMDDIMATSPVTSVEEALQGQLGGVDIITGGGDPGARSSIRIRGTSTLNASSEPLIVIDGVPYSTDIEDDFDFSTANNEDIGQLVNISPSDIESIEVLKDASATAIWGTKGSNGVLLINTKKGSKGKTRFNFTSKFSAYFEPKSIPMLDGNEYVSYMQDAIWNAANYVGFTSGSSNYLNMLFNTPEINDQPDWLYYDEYNQNTDWMDEVKQTNTSWENNFSMSGGGDKATYRFSLGYVTHGGTQIGTSMRRLNTSLNVTYNFSERLQFGADFSYSDMDQDKPWANIRKEAFSKMPNKSPYYIDDVTGKRTSQYFSRQDGSYESTFTTSSDDYDKTYNFNPVAMGKESTNNTRQREEKLTFRLQYKFLQALQYNGWVSLQMRNTRTERFLPQIATGVVWTDPYANKSSEATSDQLSLQMEHKLLFIKNWNQQHHLIMNALIRTSQTQKSTYSSTTSGNASSSLSDPANRGIATKMGSGDSEVRSISGIGLINYTLLDRYVIHGSVNMESNSAMGKDKRMGYFPAAGVAWNIHNESFLIDKDWLEEAKVRFSVGQSGNAPGGAGLYLGAYKALGSYMDMVAMKPDRMQLNSLKWETSTEYNVGADFSFWQGRLKFTFEWYTKHVKDLLQSKVDVPSTTGYSQIKYFNSGELTNKGWDFRTDVIFLKKKDWQLSGYVNIARNINEVTKLSSNMADSTYSFGNGNYAVRVIEGNPVGSFYGYRYKGVYQNTGDTYARDASGTVMRDVAGNPLVMRNGTATCYPGDAMYEDINHDGVINQYDIVYLGNAMPIVTGGAGLSLKWKQLTLSSFFHFRLGQKVINQARMDNEAMYNKDNQSKAVLKRWRNEGDDTDIPRALYNQGYNYLGSDRFVEKASYVRLKSLSLNYQVPKRVCQQWGITGLSVYVTGYDLFTWTKYTGQDPEVSLPSKATDLVKDKAYTPVSIRMACGVNINF